MSSENQGRGIEAIIKMDVLLQNYFSVADYCVFAALMLVSSFIGVYFAYGGKQKDTKEYLMAGRDMHWFPVMVSLLVSYLSAITLLGVPSEIYTYGVQYVVLIFSYFILIAVGVVIFLPMFYRLQIVSSNEYLQRRFSTGVRSLGCTLVSLQYILYMAVVLYAPSLALEAVAGVPLTATIIATGLVCTFYTTLGGMKAVIWTDVFQATVMVIGLIVVVIVGSAELGGFGVVIDRINAGERNQVFDFNPDPRVRNTFWTLAIGGAFTAMPVWTVCQPAVQRFQACRTMAESKKALFMNLPGLIFIVSLCIADGAVIYAVYANCDIGAYGLKLVSSNDQILPYFIIHKLGKYHGVPGLFTSCLFSGALSTASSGLNSIAAIFLEDIVKQFKPDISEKAATRLSKIIACTLGIIVIGLAFLVSVFGTMVLQLAYSIFGIIGGPYLGLFLLGMMVPWSNWAGAYCGCFIGVTSTFWVVIGAIIYPPNKHPQVVRMTNCSANVWNATSWANGTIPDKLVIYPAIEYVPKETSLKSWYDMSYLWYAAIGIWFTFVGGCLFSLLFRALGFCDRNEHVASELLFDYSEFFYSILPKSIASKFFEEPRGSKYDDDVMPLKSKPIDQPC